MSASGPSARLAAVADPMLFRDRTFSHDGGDEKVTRAKGEVMIREAYFDFHCHQNWCLDFGGCPSKRNRALVVLADIEASFWTKKFGNVISCF